MAPKPVSLQTVTQWDPSAQPRQSTTVPGGEDSEFALLALGGHCSTGPHSLGSCLDGEPGWSGWMRRYGRFVADFLAQYRKIRDSTAEVGRPGIPGMGLCRVLQRSKLSYTLITVDAEPSLLTEISR